MPFVQTQRGRFFCMEYGVTGPVVYLLHGLTAKSQDWGGVPDILAKSGFHVFAFDMRGHGATFSHYSQGRPLQGEVEEDYSPEGHARDLDACARALGHLQVHLVGHSTGGRNALVFAALFPEKTLTLTIVDQTLTADPDSWKKYLQRYTEYPTPFPDEASLDLFLRRKFPADERRFRYYKGQFWKKENGEWDWNFSPQAAWKTQKLGREKENYGWLARVQCPALFIKGGDSRYVSPEEAEKIIRLLPKGSLAVVEKAEHAVFRDNPEGFLKVLVPFLKGREFPA